VLKIKGIERGEETLGTLIKTAPEDPRINQPALIKNWAHEHWNQQCFGEANHPLISL
jgi:hypothetical protein